LEWQVRERLDELLFHHPAFDLQDDKFIHDDPRSRDPGYGFTSDPRNSWQGKLTVLKHILTTPHLFESFAYYDEKGNMH